MRWSLIFTLIGVVLWSPPEVSAKVGRFTDKEGTLHISNDSPAEPGKPGVLQAPDPVETSPPTPTDVCTTSPRRSPRAAGRPNRPPPPSPSSRTGAAGMIFPANRSRRPDPKDHDLWIVILPV